MPKVDTQELEDRLSRVYSPPASPLIDRRPLSPTTEAELKEACAAVARDYKPTDEEIRERRQADARAAQIARSQREEAVRKQQQLKHASLQLEGHPSVNATHPARRAQQPLQQQHGGATWSNDAVHEPTHSRQPPATAYGEKQADVRQLKSNGTAYPLRRSSLLPPPPEAVNGHATGSQAQRQSTTSSAAARQSSDSAPSTPRSASTDLRFGHPSTDRTSVAWSPSRSSKHTSRSHLPLEAIPGPRTNPLSDAWFYREYKRTTPPEVSRPPSSNLKDVRSSSRGGRIKRSLEEYIRPSLPNNSTVSLERKQRPSSQIWKSWGPSKRTSQPDLGNDRGRATRRVDLNRELPPLPSLDQWKDYEQQPQDHVAALMKGGQAPSDRGRQSKRNTAAFMSMPDLHDHQDVVVAQAVTLQAFAGTRIYPGSAVEIDASRTLDRLTSQNDAYDRYLGNVSRQRVDSAQHQKHDRHLTNSSSGSEPRNFSRAVSDGTSGHRSSGGPVTAPSAPPAKKADANEKAATTNGLGKIFGRFGRSRAATRAKPVKADGNWMDQIEAQGGVKGAVLEFDDTTGAPVIRY